mgnify:FL=1
MLGRSAKVAENDRARKQRELNALLTRDKELDMLFERLYEDNVAGKIDDARFARMSKRYEQEQGEISAKIKALRLELKKAEGQQMDMEDYLQMVSAEQKEYAEVFDYSKITEKSGVITDYWTNNLLDLILRKENLNGAYKQVKRNKGKGGIEWYAGR